MMFIYYQLIYQDTASRVEILIGLVVLCECDKNIYVKDMQNPFLAFIIILIACHIIVQYVAQMY